MTILSMEFASFPCNFVVFLSRYFPSEYDMCVTSATTRCLLLLVCGCLASLSTGIVVRRRDLANSELDDIGGTVLSRLRHNLVDYLALSLDRPPTSALSLDRPPTSENYYGVETQGKFDIRKRRPFHRFLRFGRNAGYSKHADGSDPSVSMAKRGPFVKIGKIPSSVFLRQRALSRQSEGFRYPINSNSIIRVG